MIVYLSGSMLNDRITSDWRLAAQARLAAMSEGTIECRNPFRGEDMTSFPQDGLNGVRPGFDVMRDRMDVQESNVMLLNTVSMTGMGRQSIGTWAEFGWATALGIPVIVIATDPNITRHPFIVKLAALVVPSLDEALAAILWLR